MSLPPPAPPEAKQRLLEAAEEVFAEKGFASATIREIKDRAKVNIAAINYYFGDKERLYIEAVKYAHHCSGKELPPPELLADLSPVDKLRAFIRMMATWMTAPVRLSSVKLITREFAEPTAAAKEVVRESIQPVALRLKAILHELLPHVSEAKCLMIGFSVMGQVLFYRQNRRVAELIFGRDHVEAITTDDIVEHVTGFTLAALGQGGTP